MKEFIYLKISGFSPVRLLKNEHFRRYFETNLSRFHKHIFPRNSLFQDLYIPASINLKRSNSYTL